MRRPLAVLACAALALSLALFAEKPGPGRAVSSITAGSAFTTVDYLASPQFAGRLSGTPGYLAAAKWVAGEAKRAGLTAPKEFPDYLQPFTHALGGVESASLALLPEEGKEGAPEELAFYKDFMPMLNAGSGEVAAEVVFAGYGMRAPEKGRDDYAGIDVKGKVVMVLRGEPEGGDWKPFNSTQSRTHAAADAGAAAFLMVDSAVLSANDRIEHDLPEFMVNEALADRLLAGQKLTIAELKKVLSKGGTASFPTGRKVRVSLKAKPQRQVETANVVALLPGSDPSVKGEYVVVGSHLDHLGDWPQLNPGADDNASGSATLLEVARAAGLAGAAPRRTVVFVWFAAEEVGLLGAAHFAEHPPAGLTECVAVLNLDMTGAGSGAYVSGGENFPEIFAALEAARDRYVPGMALKSGRIRGEARADHGPFYDKGVHAVSLFGMGGSHHGYHTAEDTAYFVTPKNMESVGRVVFAAAWALADSH